MFSIPGRIEDHLQQWLMDSNHRRRATSHKPKDRAMCFKLFWITILRKKYIICCEPVIHSAIVHLVSFYFIKIKSGHDSPKWFPDPQVTTHSLKNTQLGNSHSSPFRKTSGNTLTLWRSFPHLNFLGLWVQAVPHHEFITLLLPP